MGGRGKIIFLDLDHLLLGLKSVLSDPEITVLRIKNRLDPRYEATDTGGYRDLLMNVQIGSNTHICEIQLHLSTGHEYWESIKNRVQSRNMTGYDQYVEFRRLKGKAKAVSYR